MKLPPLWTYEDWCEGIRAGRNYVGEGKSHLLDFQASAGPHTIVMGEDSSELCLTSPGKIHTTARVAARLNPEPAPEISRRLRQGKTGEGSNRQNQGCHQRLVCWGL